MSKCVSTSTGKNPCYICWYFPNEKSWKYPNQNLPRDSNTHHPDCPFYTKEVTNEVVTREEGPIIGSLTSSQL